MLLKFTPKLAIQMMNTEELRFKSVHVLKLIELYFNDVMQIQILTKLVFVLVILYENLPYKIYAHL